MEKEIGIVISVLYSLAVCLWVCQFAAMTHSRCSNSDGKARQAVLCVFSVVAVNAESFHLSVTLRGNSTTHIPPFISLFLHVMFVGCSRLMSSHPFTGALCIYCSKWKSSKLSRKK